MKKIIIAIVILLSINAVHGQGIKFEHNLSWEQVKAKAKVENKYLFLDCFATWCGPCKLMSRNIFTVKEVGDYMNKNFICVAVQMDQTKSDSDAVRKWYADAKLIGDTYSVDEYPTYLFFAPDGQVVHRITGATGDDWKDFVSRAKDTFDPDKQYYILTGNYKKHLDDSLYMFKALASALEAGDVRQGELISNDFVACLHNPFVHQNGLKYIREAVQSSKDKGFMLFLNNSERIDSIFHNQSFAEDLVWVIIASEQIDPLFSEGHPPVVWEEVKNVLKRRYPQLDQRAFVYFDKIFQSRLRAKEFIHRFYQKNAPIPNWEAVLMHIKKQYPGYDATFQVAREKPKYFEHEGFWRECIEAAFACMKKYGRQVDSAELNAWAWDVFMHSDNKNLLSKALEWSRRTIPDSLNFKHDAPEYIDTYANLLFRLGQPEQAIHWEKAADLVTDNEEFANDLKNTVKRMESGQNTWAGRDKNEEYQ